MVTGIDRFTWSAYEFNDSYFSSQKLCSRHYHSMKDGKERFDPLSGSFGPPSWEPREYFLKVVEFQLREVHGEWHFVINELQRAVDEHVLSMPCPSGCNAQAAVCLGLF